MSEWDWRGRWNRLSSYGVANKAAAFESCDPAALPGDDCEGEAVGGKKCWNGMTVVGAIVAGDEDV